MIDLKKATDIEKEEAAMEEMEETVDIAEMYHESDLENTEDEENFENFIMDDEILEDENAERESK